MLVSTCRTIGKSGHPMKLHIKAMHWSQSQDKLQPFCNMTTGQKNEINNKERSIILKQQIWTSVPLSAAVSGPSGSLSPIGCTPPLQTVVKTDKTTGSSTAQHVNSVFSQLQRKRCATHYHIARNILHQQFTKTDPLLSAGSGSIYATKRNDVNCFLLEQSTVVSKQSEKHLPVSNQNCAQEKGFGCHK
ncbi:hypothetical protein KIW84_011484 [Lathyrus oleraceus]|uniref:Uncharacterized protein n=1 Tax=Pisum sativum TaxID=3888 RepID=A0A9D5GUQ7_PEA|nr:hypothetical protein KIW84_011483 [Pisum sativum]KAI5442426.1 hypothetical protein KIW84_011484 [Pisum sativum]